MSEWTTALATGVPEIDQQHQAIFRWLAELESASCEERTLFGVYALTRLRNNMRTHFAAEEALMKAAGYPGLAAHMAEHAYFRKRLEELHFKSISEDISCETVHFLQDWLRNHIAMTDLAYVPFLQPTDRPAAELQ